MATFQVDGGFDFHQAFIDIPEGSYQLIWEVQLDQLEPVETVKNYHAAIDDIEISPKLCNQMRKFWNKCFLSVKDIIYFSYMIDSVI